MTLFEALEKACADAGVVFKRVAADGRWHVTDLADDPHGRGDGRIKLFADGQGGIVCNWKAGAPQAFFLDDDRELSEEERQDRDRKRREAIRQAEVAEARGRGRK